MISETLSRGRTEEDDLFLMDDDEQDAQADKYLLFKIGAEIYGIDIRQVTEIIELQKVTAVPDMPEYVKGVINLRGRVIPVIDVRLRFGMAERPSDDRTCIVVVNIDKSPIGLLVDTVAEVQDIPEKNIEPAPHFKTASGHDRYVSGLGKVGEEVRILLDVEKLLYGEDAAAIAGIAV